MSAIDVVPPGDRSARHATIVGVIALAVVFVVGLLWAKWLPYGEKIGVLAHTGTWSGTSILDSGSGSVLAHGWHFTVEYFRSVWKAGLVALLVAAAVDSLVPRAKVVALLNRSSPARQSLAGGLFSVPSLMCTCCTAPVAVSLRQRGVALTASLAYWIGNPILNPAVLAFLFLTAPWQVGVVRIIVGALLVFGATLLIGRWFGDRADERFPAAQPAAPDATKVADLPVRYVRSLARFAVILIPEFVAVIFVLGMVSGPLSHFSGLDARFGVIAVIVCTLVGTMLVIPTAGEIPIVLALVSTGIGVAPAGALLITLPALSIPSMLLVGRSFTWRATAAMAAAVMVGGLLSAALLFVLW